MPQSLEERMKGYEQKIKLPENLPVIIRIDGRAFHTLTRGMAKPFDHIFINRMNDVAIALCKEVQNCRMAYVQSDEISLLLYQKRDAHPWFGNEIQKITSITASIASSVYTRTFACYDNRNTVVAFDSRAFVMPHNDVVNYFIWRQLDWMRNSVQMLARSHFSHNDLKNVSTTEMHELLLNKGVDWNEIKSYLRKGRTAIKVKSMEPLDDEYNIGDEIEYYERTRWTIDDNIPVFTKDRGYIESKLEPDFALNLGKTVMKVHMKV
ncbi:tRNA(His) guanylyltransferase Thg1 family protein [Candidatus Dependentiae bacterium]|nr:tRNA(His) guanylyltransferase Thg1 family protein [Candidatus Dependentiae bacterium]